MHALAHAPRSARTPIAAASLAALLLAGCTVPVAPTPGTPAGASGSPAAVTPTIAVTAATPGASAGSEASTFGVDPAVVAEVRSLCAPGPGKTVEELPDVAIPAVTWPGVSVSEQHVGTKTVPALDIAAVDLPATTAEAGCLVTYDAPAGCLSAVEISPSWIPGYRIEGYSFLDEGRTVTVEPLEADAVTTQGAKAEQRCQLESSGQYVNAVYRGAIHRGAIYRGAQYRAAQYRAAVHDSGAQVAGLTIPGRTVLGVTMLGTSIRGASLPSRKVAKDITAVEDETTVAYEASESVLFDYNKSALLPSAAAALDAILADAAQKGFAGKVRVEGHTDDTGEEAPNQKLSEARAQAVADYLGAHGIAAGRLTVTGRGESAPAYPNDTDANRAKNRRVVIEFRQQ
ncbi:MAG TPA: OmpA family protein [Propioniciclava tarda]|nr:OmpA family protein [Propioniciclava tarda]HQA31119.1 OmpA family protein [Propioniciclava tarda]HQD60244.1 OmpA family protein [Propioniciclava tarda]